MTGEEAIAILIREIDEDPFIKTKHREQIHDALNMAIKSLEAWGKLRSEIMAIGNWRNKSEISDNGVKDCLAIIDRHIAEIMEWANDQRRSNSEIKSANRLRV